VLGVGGVVHGELQVHPVHALHDGAVTRYRHLDHVRDVLADHGVAAELRPTTTSWIINARQTLICSRAPDQTGS
jgi:hypothetical protein